MAPPRWRSICLGCLALFLIWPPASARASMHEQLIMDARSMALGNAVTADPPGIMSMHFNPAGLTNLDEGWQVSNSFAGISIQAKSRFLSDDAYATFLPGQYVDPLANTSGRATGLVVYVPGYGDSVTLPATVVLPTNAGIAFHKPGSKFTFSTGLYSPLIGGFARGGDGNPLQYGAHDYYWQHMIISPTLGYQMTPTLSLGLSVGLGFGAMGIATDVRLPNTLVALTDILGDATNGLAIPPLTNLTLPPPWFNGGLHPYESPASLEFAGVDNFAPSYNLGLLWEPKEWFSFGLVYHSPIEQEITGKYTMSYSQNFQNLISWLGSSPFLIITSGFLGLPINPVAAQTGTFTTDMTIPRMVQAGFKIKPFRFMSILTDLNWAQWSIRTEDRIVFDQDIQALQLARLMGYAQGNRDFVMKRNLKDTINYSIGLEFYPADWLTLRLGYQKRYSSIPLEFIDTIWNFPDWDVYCAGFGLKMKNGMAIDVGASWVKSDTLTVQPNQSSHLNNTNFTHPIYSPYAGLTYEQDFDIYMVGLTVTMPISVMHHMTEDLLKRLGHIAGFLNPF